MTTPSADPRVSRLASVPLLPTTVIGSYPMPEWMERLKTDYHRGRMSHTQLQDLHDTAIKAAVHDQELTGIDIVSDGELRRDNAIDYFLARMPGIDIHETGKRFYLDYYESTLRAPLPTKREPAPLGLVEDFTFTAAQTRQPVKYSLTGPFSLACRVHDEAYPDRRELLLAIAGLLNAEAHTLAEHGAELLQIDEPFLAGYPNEVGIAVEAINTVTAGVPVTWALHVCYGNRYARPHWEGHYDFLFPTVLDTAADQLVLEFARRDFEDLPVLEKFGWDRAVGLGVLDVHNTQVESPELIASRIRRALEFIPADRLMINPDCGLRTLPGPVARAKLAAMVQGATLARNDSLVPPPGPILPPPATDPARTESPTGSIVRGP